MAKQNPALYAPRAFKFNTGDHERGIGGVIDVPAGISRILTAEEANHSWVQLHTAAPPSGDVAGDDSVRQAEIAGLVARNSELDAKVSEQASTIAGMSEELEGLRVAIAQSPDERVAAAEKRAKDAQAKLAACESELAGVRAELSKSKRK